MLTPLALNLPDSETLTARRSRPEIFAHSRTHPFPHTWFFPPSHTPALWRATTTRAQPRDWQAWWCVQGHGLCRHQQPQCSEHPHKGECWWWRIVALAVSHAEPLWRSHPRCVAFVRGSLFSNERYPDYVCASVSPFVRAPDRTHLL